MIRRIVDSVSLLTDVDLERINPDFQDGCSLSKLTASNETKISLINRSPSSTGSSDNVDVKDTDLFTSYRHMNTLSSTGSCYIAPNYVPLHSTSAHCDEKNKASRSPSPAPARRQSPSPGRVDPSSFASRQLPGGGPSLQQRAQRAQPVRKKEHAKGITTVSKSVKPSKVNKTGKTEEALSTADDDEKEEKSSGMASQADPLAMSVECYVLPFLQDLKAIELRVPAQGFSKAQRRLLKVLASENDLLIMSMGKPLSADQEEPMIVIRKRATLQYQQGIQWEKEQREAAERARLRAEEEERKRRLREREELIRTNQLHHETSCQANFDDPEPTVSRKKARRLRRERRRKANANKKPPKPKVVDSEMQTVPEDYWLCPWCLQHIPPESLCGHEVVCRAGVRLKQKEQELKARLEQRNADAEARRRQRLGLPPLKTQKKQPVIGGTPTAPGKTEAPSGRSRSRTRLLMKTDKTKKKPSSRPRSRSASKTDPRNEASVVNKLDTVHPNDLEGMAKLMQRVCSQPGCDQLYNAGDPATRSSIKCLECRFPYCDRHRPVGMHQLCPTPEKPEPPTKPGAVSTACGWDIEEKRAALKTAIRERRIALQERRQRY